MKRLTALRPSPALVIACLALFISLGGVSYGLATGYIDTGAIRNNTVRTQDLRNNDIRAVDIRNSTIRSRDVALNTLTGNDINESKLGQVPSAATSDDLGGVAASDYLRRKTSAFVPLTPATDWESIPNETRLEVMKPGPLAARSSTRSASCTSRASCGAPPASLTSHSASRRRSVQRPRSASPPTARTRPARCLPSGLRSARTESSS